MPLKEDYKIAMENIKSKSNPTAPIRNIQSKGMASSWKRGKAVSISLPVNKTVGSLTYPRVQGNEFKEIGVRTQSLPDNMEIKFNNHKSTISNSKENAKWRLFSGETGGSYEEREKSRPKGNDQPHTQYQWQKHKNSRLINKPGNTELFSLKSKKPVNSNPVNANSELISISGEGQSVTSLSELTSDGSSSSDKDSIKPDDKSIGHNLPLKLPEATNYWKLLRNRVKALEPVGLLTSCPPEQTSSITTKLPSTKRPTYPLPSKGSKFYNTVMLARAKAKQQSLRKAWSSEQPKSEKKEGCQIKDQILEVEQFKPKFKCSPHFQQTLNTLSKGKAHMLVEDDEFDES